MTPIVIEYRDLRKYKYQIKEDVTLTFPTELSFCDDIIDIGWVRLHKNKMTVKALYCWDGASCAIDTEDFMIGSLFHDALYQLIRMMLLSKIYRKKADLVLKWIVLCCDMPEWRAAYVYRMVRIFGGKHIKIGVPQDIIHICVMHPTVSFAKILKQLRPRKDRKR